MTINRNVVEFNDPNFAISWQITVHQLPGIQGKTYRKLIHSFLAFPPFDCNNSCWSWQSPFYTFHYACQLRDCSSDLISAFCQSQWALSQPEWETQQKKLWRRAENIRAEQSLVLCHIRMKKDDSTNSNSLLQRTEPKVQEAILRDLSTHIEGSMSWRYWDTNKKHCFIAMLRAKKITVYLESVVIKAAFNLDMQTSILRVTSRYDMDANSSDHPTTKLKTQSCSLP